MVQLFNLMEDASGESGYNEIKTTTYFKHSFENGSESDLRYDTGGRFSTKHKVLHFKKLLK
jgi:hypothetical protein